MDLQHFQYLLECGLQKQIIYDRQLKTDDQVKGMKGKKDKKAKF